MSKVKLLIEVDPDTQLEIEKICTSCGRNFSDFFLECYREKVARDAVKDATYMSDKIDSLRKKNKQRDN